MTSHSNPQAEPARQPASPQRSSHSCSKEEILSRIDDFSVVFAELKAQSASRDGWVDARCPFHDDEHPSFGFNRRTGRWRCFAGCGSGSAIDFLMKRSGIGYHDALAELAELTGMAPRASHQTARPPIRESVVKQWAAALEANPEARMWLRDARGLTDRTIKRYEIGWDASRRRYTIPIRDERGNLVNIRLYSAESGPKMINYVDGDHRYGSPPRLYGVDELVKHLTGQVIVCEGEWDRLLLCQEGFTAVTGTHGAGTFRPEWADYFAGKDVVVLYDCDGTGQDAAQNAVLPVLGKSGATSLRNVVLPLRGSKDDKDVTDYLVGRGLSAESLRQLINDATPLDPSGEREQDEAPIELTSFAEIDWPDLIDKKVACQISVCGETSETFHAVTEFRVTACNGASTHGCQDCVGRSVTLPPGSQELIASCMSTNLQVVGMLRDYVCKYGRKPTLEILSRTTVTELFCTQRVRRTQDARGEDGGQLANAPDGAGRELVEKKVYYLSSDHPRPGIYRAVGWVKTHPKTQHVTFLIESLDLLQEEFECFSLTESAPLLRAFSGLSHEEVLRDLRTHVTGIYERDEILEAALLTYCSPRWLLFNGEKIRGWLVTVIIGDAGSGKTQTVQRIAEFIEAGDRFSGLSGSRTGLAYALVEHKQKGWQVRIGRYPANSRRLLIVDEAQHLSQFDLRVLAKSMEEGFLQIDRVQSRGYESETRLILIANPKGDAVMDSFAFGCEALCGFLSAPIIRRTDIAVFANSGDLTDPSVINQPAARAEGRKISPEMLRAVVFWAWNLRLDQIQFTGEATSECLRRAGELSEAYGYAFDVPLITTSDCRNNLARIAAAYAILRVSADDDFTRLCVTAEHVQAAVEFLVRLYSHENCALGEYSALAKDDSQLLDYDEIDAAFLKKINRERKHGPGDDEYFIRLIGLLRNNKVIRRDDLAEQAGCTVDTVGRTVRFLKAFNLIDSTREGYVKKPKFNKFLRRFLKDHPEILEQISRKDKKP